MKEVFLDSGLAMIDNVKDKDKVIEYLAREVWLAERERERDWPRGREGGSTMDCGRPPDNKGCPPSGW